LAQADYDRVNELAAKARADTLTTEERTDLNEYERITCLVELMQSKARLSLKGGKYHDLDCCVLPLLASM